MADIISLIQKNLESLKVCQENISDDNEGTITDLIKTIHDTYMTYSFKVQERENINAFLLNVDTGILSSLRAFLLIKDFRSVKSECFKLLNNIIEHSSENVQEYGFDIQSICILYVKREALADIKKASLVTLSKVLETCHGFQGEKRIQPKPIIEALFSQLSLPPSKLSLKTKEEILCVIGIIAHYYPEDFIPYQDRVLSMFLQELKEQVNIKSKKPNLSTIAGCLQGLKEYLYNFPVLCSEETEKSYFIFNTARMMIMDVDKFDTKTSSAIRAGLQMIAAHASQFSTFVFEDSTALFKKLMEWVEAKNRDMQKLGRDAVVAILKVTSEMIMNEFANDENYCKKVFQFFLESFRSVFLSSDVVDPKKFHVAVIGYGLFAGPCKLCLNEDMVKLMLQNIIQKSDHEFFRENEDINDNIMVLPCYIESLASIVSNIEFIPDNTLFALKKLVIFQIDKFPKVPSAYSFIVPKAIILLLVSLQPKGEIFIEFLSEIVFQGLVKTCSHPVAVEAENLKDRIANKEENESFNQYDKTSMTKVVTYKDYLYLWRNILNVVQLKDLSSRGVSLQDRQYLMECIYDQLIRASLDLISKLDLTLLEQVKQDNAENESDDEPDISSDPLHGNKPKNVTDYYIFLNIVDFLRDLLSESCTELFSKWVYLYGREMISYSTVHPFHSGFYKLISLNLSICTKIDYFKGNLCESEISVNDESIVTASFQLFSKFVKEIVVRLQQFKDEMLASCLQILLVLPIEIVLQEITILIPALEIALKLGMSYLPLATNAIHALEKWTDSVPLEKLQPYFPRLLPYLNNYIYASSSHDACSIPVVKQLKSTKKAHKISTKYAKKRRSTLDMMVVDDPELQKIQLRIIKYLGKLGKDNSALLQNSFEDMNKVAIAWDSLNRNHLKYAVPFVDMKPEIFFDDFLPRVLEVATKSSVRQVKVAACEALHSLVLYMIGRGSQMPEDLKEKFSMEALYKNIFPGLLELACDVEQVAKQLFRPLVFQIIHWFTHSRVIKTPESSVILLALWDGVTHKENSSLRDLSALCLKEYFQWFLKQAPEGKGKLIESLLNKLTSFSLHPSPFKRMGAALTFNNIYKIFRNEEELVKNFSIQLLVQFIDSLAIAHNDDKSFGTQKQCLIALDHLEKIIVVKHKYFLKPSKNAKVPSCLKDSSLKSVVQWLLYQCGCIQTECRHKCMDLVIKLSSYILGSKDPVTFLVDYNVEEKNIFEDIFERALRNKSDSVNLTSFKDLSMWLEALLTSLECYHWAFSDSLLLQNILDGVEHANLLSSVKIFNITKYFISNIAKESLSAVTKTSSINSISIYSPEEESKYNRLKCSVIVRLMSFIISVFKNNAKWFHQKFLEILWNPDLWEVLMYCVVHPSYIGFDMGDPEIFNNLPKEVSFLLESCLSKQEDFKKFCYAFLESSQYCLSKKLPLSLKSVKDDSIKLIQIFTGYKQLISCGLWSPKHVTYTSENDFINNLLKSVATISSIKDFSTNQKKVSNPLVLTVAEKMLSVTYALGLKEEDLAVRLLNRKELLENKNLSEKETLVFNNFVKNICEFTARNPRPFVRTIVNNLNHTSCSEISILLKFIDYVARTKTLRRNYGKQVIDSFLMCWEDIYCWSSDHPDVDKMYSILSIMSKMLLIDSEVAFNSTCAYSSSLYPSYLKLLRRDHSNNLDFIVHAFDILPFFLDSDQPEIRECLERIIALHFPLQSTELKSGSSAYHTYISALKKLLSALQLTGCEFLLEILTLLVCKERDHIIEEDFKKSVIKMVKRSEESQQEKFASLIFKIILNEKCSLRPSVLLDILEKVLITLLQNCRISSFICFYKIHIKTIIKLMKGASPNVTEDIKIVRKIYGFRLCEILYGTLSKDLVHGKDSEIVEIYLGHKPQNGNEMSSEIIKCCQEFKSTSFERELLYKELLRKLNCASYSTLISIISCTQTDVKFYDGFLFKESPVKNELIWERIIDKEKSLKFDIELDAPLQRQKKFTSIRHQMRINNKENASQNDSNEIQSSLQLLGSESLALSSLAEDASKFVFSTDEQTFKPEKDELISESKIDKFGYIKKEEQYGIDVIELEEDDLNKHECMIALSYVMKHMKSIGIIPTEYNDNSPPKWINFLAQTLEASNIHINIKLFVGRLIVNNAKVLQPYAKFLLKPLMKLVASGEAGTELNYYILDIIITLLSWAPTYVPEKNLTYEACELLKFLIRNCDHTRREIFRNNMEVIKTVLECWKDVLEIPYDDIYQKMKDSDPESKKNLFGIQLLGIVLLCDFPPFDSREESRGLSYLNVLLKNLSHKYKEVHGSAAEVTALVLKYFVEKKGNIEDNPFYLKVVQHLEILKNQGSESKFLYCLNKIHFGCPKVADKFISKLLFLYPSIHGPFKEHMLEVLCARVESIPSAFKELKAIGIFENMEKKNESVQFLSLQALEKLIPSLSCDDILIILPDIVEIHTQPSVRCRLALFKILFVLFETYSKNEGAKEKIITKYAQETLIAGLADPDQSVRLTVDNFWSDEKRLPSGTKERLIALLKNLYSPATEESFLQYATFLMLERTSNSPDYKRKIFEHPLTQCNFQTYQIQISWRKRHVAMSPMFTETVSSSLSSSLISGDSFDKSFAGADNFVKATQVDYGFSETVDPSKISKSGTYNWLTEKSMDTFAFEGSANDSFLGSFSSSSGKSHLIALKGSKSPTKNVKSGAETKRKEDKTDRSSVWMLKRRFLKDKGNSDTFAKQELRRQDRRQELLKEQQSRRESQVEMYRQYRIGELPDIEISNSAIIAPVQALAMNDVVIARLLFKSLVISICDYIKEDCPEEYNSLLSEIGACFKNILNSSYIRTPAVISFCLESLNQLQDVDFDAESVFVASIGSNQQSIGILLLESKILKGFEYQPNVKRKRSERQAISEERTFWMNLAELYRSLNDYDIVNGIFSYTMGKRKENRRALQLEASGHYFEAFELYNKLYEEASDEYDQAEKDFWDKSVLSCLDKLTKWENLESIVTERFTDPNCFDLQRIWEDQYIKDNYLPYWVRSKMKRLLEGKQDQTLLDFFDAAKKDEDKRVLLENYAEDLALLYILQDRFDIARQFSSDCLNKFLKNWQNLSPLAVGMQSSNLQNLLIYVELDEFLDLMKRGKFLNSSSTVNLLHKWQKRYPSSTDPVNIWDDVCSNRILYLRKLQEKFELKSDEPAVKRQKISSYDSQELLDTNVDGKPDLKKLALDTAVLMKINFADNSAEQKNFPVALKKLKEIYKVSKSLDQNVWSKFIQSYCSINNKRCSYSDKKLDILLQSWKQLGDLEAKCGSSVAVKNLQSQTLELIGEMFMKQEIKPASLNNDQKKSLLNICGSTEKIVPILLDKSFLCLSEVLHFEVPRQDSSHVKKAASAHMELANFCNKYLRKEEDSESIQIPSLKKFPDVLTESLLTALEYGEADAFILFPRLLQIIELYPSCISLFKDKVSKMPCWLFIRWINQMVALLDKPEASALHEIIEKITISYPDAIIYPFNLSYESFKFSDSSEGQTNKAFVEKIKLILEKQTLIIDFIAALEHLSVPAVSFKEHYNEIQQLLQSKATKKEICAAYSSMYNNLFNLDTRHRRRRIPIGPLQKKFSEDFKENVESVCGVNGSKLCSSNPSEQKAALKNLQLLLQQAGGVEKNVERKKWKLNNLSPWLSDFQPWKYASQIEIPGQYTGRSKPLPEYHVKISGFDEKIMILTSVAMPRRLTIRGNDEKEYKVLVKAGEDLRQDARIQQMFSVMNEIYKSDIACTKRHLSLKTYKVIPVNNRLGLIEWVDNTVVLQSFLMDGMTGEQRERDALINAAKVKFHQSLKKIKDTPISAIYWTFYKEMDQVECVQKFQELSNLVPKNLLTKSFLKLSSSPEAFVALRTRFSTSHALICISQWVLGIGDRHLGNFLVDKSSGYEIGIDFGHAFGSATQFLPVPELMPFRLTSQYLQLLEPLRVKGIYESTMVHALSALKYKYDLLLNMLDIFIKEPTVDWKVLARKQQLEWGQELTGDDDWFPKQRITLARKKLEGVNPCYITRDELELGHCSRECFKNMETVCLGNKEHSIRAKYAAIGLSPEEQVDCLIDQATDPCLLSLTYLGWNPWV